jgi:hypothetical protein
VVTFGPPKILNCTCASAINPARQIIRVKANDLIAFVLILKRIQALKAFQDLTSSATEGAG